MNELEDYVDKKNSSYDEETKKIDSYGLGKRLLKKTGRALKTNFKWDKDLSNRIEDVHDAHSYNGVEDNSMSEMIRILNKRKGAYKQ